MCWHHFNLFNCQYNEKDKSEQAVSPSIPAGTATPDQSLIKNLKEIKEKEKIELVREAAKKKKNDAIEAFIKCRDEFNC